MSSDQTYSVEFGIRHKKDIAVGTSGSDARPQSLATLSNPLPKLSLEPERHPRLVAEVALVVVATRKAVAKAGQEIVKLRRPESNALGKGNINASADDEIKRIVAG
jgi:hypothetical protein